eukprot:scaffold3025_cov132-Isochrysis_galbana.AAC.10
MERGGDGEQQQLTAGYTTSSASGRATLRTTGTPAQVHSGDYITNSITSLCDNTIIGSMSRLAAPLTRAVPPIFPDGSQRQPRC